MIECNSNSKKLKYCNFIIAFLILLFTSAKAQTVKILFDASKAEAAGNADWVIDADVNNLGFSAVGATLNGGVESNAQRIPMPAQSGITQSTSETYWKGAISYWGIDCVNRNYIVESLPYNGQITYGNASNLQDLSNYKVFVVCEPNILFTAAEKVAILTFVQNGGGLFMVSDHNISDRNSDGQDSPHIWNDLMSNNTVQVNPFGMTFDYQNFSQTTSNIPNLPTDSILNGPAGNVTQTMFVNGTSITLTPLQNPTVKGVVYKTGSTFGNANVMCAYARYGNGKVAALGDSSPCDDGTGDTGDNLFDGYIADAGGNHRKLIMNITIWLATTPTVVVNPFVADFSANDVTPCINQEIVFTNASSGTPTSYLWNFGANATPATATTAGPHTVSYATSGTKTVSLTISNSSTSNTVTKTNYINVNPPFQTVTNVLTENMGTVTSTTAISAHETNNGFQNTSLTMSGTADVRATSASSGYSTASGGANVFITNTLNRNFIVSGINTVGFTNLQLMFGLNKTTTATTISDFKVQYSINGTTWVDLSFPPLPSGAGWSYVVAVGSLPEAPNLRIQFVQLGTTNQYRVDDILLVNTFSNPVISTNNPLTFCQGGSATLTSSVASNYLWSNGATSQSISVNTTGNYYVSVSDINGCYATSPTVAVTVNTPTIWYADSDQDGYGNINTSLIACNQPLNYISNSTDCNDNQSSIYPNAVELCGNNIDDDCDTQIDEGCFVTFSLRLFIQAFYDTQSNSMVAARYNAGLSNNQLECDVFTMELRSALVPSSILFSATGTLSTTGMSSFQIPVSLLGNSYYVVVHHRNSIETWSKFPVTFIGNAISFDFTTP